eukprot:m.259132 g.259132  ORF g.259132 m.259132 type:complete len:271 (+) comp15975_c0_seq2:2373-3185(+)
MIKLNMDAYTTTVVQGNGMTRTTCLTTSTRHRYLDMGATNFGLRGENGTCIAPHFFSPPDGTFWSEWPPQAAAIVANAGRHAEMPLTPIFPSLSPPAVKPPTGGDVCIRFGTQPCESWNTAQNWHLAEGVTPRSGRITTIKSAIPTNSTMYSCWAAQIASTSSGCQLHSPQVLCEDGCQPLPLFSAEENNCMGGAWYLNTNGTITTATITSKGTPLCISKGSHGVGTAITLTPCKSQDPTQIWTFVSNKDGSVTIEQNGMCITNNYRIEN